MSRRTVNIFVPKKKNALFLSRSKLLLMSIKTNIPSLSDLTKVFGPIDSDNYRTTLNPLCSNIFDVQRGELMEEYERLREAFWKNSEHYDIQSPLQNVIQSKAIIPSTQIQLPVAAQAVPPPIVPVHTSSPRKRTLPDDSPNANKRRKSMKQVEAIDISHTSSRKAYASLSDIKYMLVKQLRVADRYDEARLLSLLSDVKSLKPSKQIRHLASYLFPVAKAMRRDVITKALQQWLSDT